LSIVEVIKADEVTCAEMNQRDGCQCIRVSFKKNKDRFLNLDTSCSDKNLYENVLKAYNSLIGKIVAVNCWDPEKEPGLYSNSDWFKDMRVLNDDESISAHISAKGFCEVCGIADGLLNYSKGAKGKWLHYSCKFNREGSKKSKSNGCLKQIAVPNILIEVNTNVVFADGSINTVLKLSDGTKKTINIKVFDRNLAITKKAKSLIGEKVKTTCWDPINEPGKWSSLGYFNDIDKII
jgi:hypothetical protein